MNKVENRIIEYIERGDTVSPFLFLSRDLELLHREIETLVRTLFDTCAIDKSSLLRLADTGESIKIEEMRNFLAQAYEKPRFRFQVFFIENISRMTLQSANASLKFLEEPGEGNIVFLTNKSEADILDTILSRVQIVQSDSSLQFPIRQEYYTLVKNYYESKDTRLVSYLFTEKLEKEDYQDMLQAMLGYIGDSQNGLEFLDELEQDIQGLEKNSLNGKYVVDKYLGKMIERQRM